MSAVQQIKDERINLRLKNQAKAVLERAASLEGKTVSSFILASALQQAEQTIAEHEVMKLNAQDARAFFEALGSVKANDKLKAAFAAHDRRVTSR
ncbi:DUF1778 domain-containing protein [Thalassolituus pacificus]|jgi:uncharacterized protein (DUF1778 family)|uniref:DUF1778 domain-containing protein n=1 Tax=Thalassolituus pacificus TaxID=2975440 RepID=A0A9X2WDV0_9GAMM|nr:DUF1778 domain-containing protein [Thalassolituus pacificus]MCT7358596.1 DUF1778 domain-containing protein [Thalassolituus pacificus]